MMMRMMMRRMRSVLLVLLFTGAINGVTAAGYGNDSKHIEYPPYDGWYVNPHDPDWGAIDGQLLRILPAAYSDGTYEPSGTDRPNPIEISDNVFDGQTGLKSAKGRTAFLVFFGQQVVEEILDAQRPGCPPEYSNIPIPKGHPQYDSKNEGGREMPFLRSRYDMRTGLSPNNPRQQLNEITPYLDGGLTYGISKAWADTLRSFKGGRLATLDGKEGIVGTYPIENSIRLPLANPPPPRDHVLKNVNRFWRLGNPRGNENPFLLTFGVLWFRYHNYHADRINKTHPDWSDEKIYNEARKWVIATHQKIVVKDWLPSWLGDDENGNQSTLPKYEGWNRNVHPGIAQEFQSAAMRFGHTLVPPGVFRRNNNCVFRNTTIATSGKTGYNNKWALRTCNVYWNPQEAVLESDIDEILMGMASQITEKEDHIITPDLRGNVFGPLEWSRRDLMAINIQRARDHGLPDYNTARVHYRLPEIKRWEDINPTLYNKRDANYMKALNGLKKVYGEKEGLKKLDIWPAGLLETTPNGPGPLFRAIIRDQFTRIRDADRFWYEDYTQNGLFTEDEVKMIDKVTIYDVVIRTTNVKTMQKNPFFWNSLTGDPCPQPLQLSNLTLEPCTPLKHYDYFRGYPDDPGQGSYISYAISFLVVGLFGVATVGCLFFMAWRHKKEMQKHDLKQKKKSMKKDDESIQAQEWVGKKEGLRDVKIKFTATTKELASGETQDVKLIQILTPQNKAIRTIDIRMAQKAMLHTSVDKHNKVILLRFPKDYDLVLKFPDIGGRMNFIEKLTTFLGKVGVGHERMEKKEQHILDEANTKAKRQKLLERFFRVVFAQAFNIESGLESSTIQGLDGSQAKEIITCELTKFEFAEALSLTPDSMFVENMFTLVDSDNNGYISFREFLDMIVIFAKGDADAKAGLLFDMYDIERKNEMKRKDFEMMLRSLMELANTSVEHSELDTLIESMFREAGLGRAEILSKEDFIKLLQNYKSHFDYTQIDFKGTGVDISDATKPAGMARGKATVIRRENATVRARRTIVRALSGPEERIHGTGTGGRKGLRRSRVIVETTKKEKPKNAFQRKWMAFARLTENYHRQIFFYTLYTLVTIGIFAERAYYYSVEREHSGLRRIAGYGVTVTRGAASAMMFTYSCLLVTMCRNLITYCRETFLNRFIPFDSAINMHKYIAVLAAFFTLMHIIGHSINFYHVATQTANDLSCIFRDYYHATHELPKFHRWCWQTITGLTGVFVTLQFIVIYVFAVQYSRRHCFKAFWNTHMTYPIFYILCFMHGSGRLVQDPLMHYFFLGPVILFVLDKLVSISRSKVEISVIKADLLPSDVTYLEFKRPLNFEYKSGQWVRIACLTQGESEYHPFTLTSAPHEDNLKLHIRAVGPWTKRLRTTYDPSKIMEHPYPKVYIDGPFGEGHQDWYKYDVSVLVGGGIGVTPFASILKDLVEKSRTGAKIRCKKVYFLWVTRTQKHFEWLTDIVREVEEKDTDNLVSVHIFITQFYHKFDLRTTMLYICERHFQKIANRSLFTGLKAVTHFGRPNFETFLDSLQLEHSEVSRIGVFSCGPPAMTNNVDQACSDLNKVEGAAFIHHFENF